MPTGRRAYAEITGFTQDLLSVSYTDNLDQADDIQITVADRDHKWCGAWYPETTTEFRASIVADAWEGGGSQTLNCGTFQVDGMDYEDGPDGSTANITGTSVPLDTAIRRENHSQGWEDTTYSEIAGEIAARGGLSLMYELDDDPKLDRIDQRQESDLGFADILAGDHGARTKVFDKKLVIFDEAKYEQRAPVCTFARGDGRLLSIQLKQDTSQTATSATTQYKDPKSGKLVEETFTPSYPPNVGNRLMVNERVADLRGDKHRGGTVGGNHVVDDFNDIRADAKGAARKKAKAKLREANRNEWTCSISAVGNPGMTSGSTFMISGYGKFDGKYIATKVTHSLTATEYTNEISGHGVLEGY